MDKAITTALLIVISMIMALLLFNIVYPAIIESGDAIASMANRASDRMDTQIGIIHAAGELDSTGWWQNGNGNSEFEVFVWVKNLGDSRISAMNSLDVFFGPEGNFTRIPHQSATNGSYPYWTWNVEGGDDWDPTMTLRITIHYQLPLTQGRYFIKIGTTGGVSAQDYLGL